MASQLIGTKALVTINGKEFIVESVKIQSERFPEFKPIHQATFVGAPMDYEYNAKIKTRNYEDEELDALDFFDCCD